MRDRIGARAPPTTSVSTIVRSAIELAVISAERGRMVGITAASAGANSWPTVEKTSVIRSRCRKSFLSPGTMAARGIGAKAAGRLDRKPDRFFHRRQSLARRFGIEVLVDGFPFAEGEGLRAALRIDPDIAKAGPGFCAASAAQPAQSAAQLLPATLKDR